MTKKKSKWDLVFIRSFNAMVIRIQSNAGWSFMVDNFRGATASADPSTGWPQLVIGDPGDPAAAKIFWGTRELAKAHGLKVMTRSTGPFGGPGAYKKLARRNPARKKKTTKRRKNATKQMGRSGRIVLNDRERELWVINDEVLYDWWKSSRLPMRKFLRTHRAALDAVIISAQTRDADRPSGYGQDPRSY